MAKWPWPPSSMSTSFCPSPDPAEARIPRAFSISGYKFSLSPGILGQVKCLPQHYYSKWIYTLLLGAGCALGSSLRAQTADPQSSPSSAAQPPAIQTDSTQPAASQPPAGSRSAVIRRMLQAEAARRAAAKQAAGQPATPTNTPAATVPTTTAPVIPTPATAAPTTPAPVAPSVGTNPQPSAAVVASATSALPPAAVKSVKVVKDKAAGSAIEIVTSRPVPPALQTLPNPPRLVIDLPNANVAVKQKEIAGKGDQFTSLHVDQFQVSPPVTRVIVDLAEAKPYTWDGAGNRLTIRLKPPEDPKAKATPPPPALPATVSTLGSASQPAVVPVASRPTGSAVIAGSRIGNGSSITASAETAVLHIARGGELHVCPGSTVSVTASKNNQDLMFGMSTGTMEAHYHLDAASDVVLTPDFRMLLSGPGDFNYAISANSHGDTCVRALLGNTASLMVSELMGERTYQVKPTEQVVFHEGRIDRVSNDVPFDCGCAAPPPPVMMASAEPTPQAVSEKALPPNVQLPSSSAAPSPRAVLDPMLPPLPNASRPAVAMSPSTQPGNVTTARSETAPPPRTRPSDIHVQIEAPLVFRGADKPKAPVETASNMPPPEPRAKPKRDPAAPIPQPPPPRPAVQEQAKPKEHHGFFGRVKGFFSSVFH